MPQIKFSLIKKNKIIRNIPEAENEILIITIILNQEIIIKSIPKQV